VSETNVEDKSIMRINRNVRDTPTHHGWTNRARFQVFEKDIG
jgi:hypothetical protein